MRYTACMLGAIVVASALLVSEAAIGQPVSDFDDCALQGWSERPDREFNGDLYVECKGGNPDGFLVVEDTQAGGGGLYVSAPSPFLGDLSTYDAIAWDEYLYDCPNGNGLRTIPFLMGLDSTEYWRADWEAPGLLVDSWVSRSMCLNESAWVLAPNSRGQASFESVLHNVIMFGFSMDHSTLCNDEAGIDNVMLVQGHVGPEVLNRFDTGVEGWSLRTVDGTTWAIMSNGVADYMQGDGNPGGHIASDDTDGYSFFFSAPHEFLCDLSWAFPGALYLDRRVTGTGTLIDGVDVLIYGVADTIGYSTDPPGSAWETDSVPMQPHARWVRRNGSSPTLAEMQALLSSVQLFLIRGEHINGSPEIGRLDNVVLTDAPITRVEDGFPAGESKTLRLHGPLPSSGTLRVSMQLSASSPITFQIYSVTGRLVRTLDVGDVSIGEHAVTWDPGLPTGTYFLRLGTEHGAHARKFTILR